MWSVTGRPRPRVTPWWVLRQGPATFGPMAFGTAAAASGSGPVAAGYVPRIPAPYGFPARGDRSTAAGDSTVGIGDSLGQDVLFFVLQLRLVK
jgi:hypothetical protein